jgi:hypothetical protein
MVHSLRQIDNELLKVGLLFKLANFFYAPKQLYPPLFNLTIADYSLYLIFVQSLTN